MLKTFYKSAIVTVILTVILCGVYPLIVFGIGQIFFPGRANGSLIVVDGKTVGSRLIGQAFSRPEYFHGRPSAAGDKGYDASNSSGSNLGPTSQKLVKTVQDNVKTVLNDNPGLTAGQVPVDLVTASGSGLDPHISPSGAEVQVARIATSRHTTPDKVRELVAKHTLSPQLGFLGEPVVNVLELNLDLDHEFPLSSITH